MLPAELQRRQAVVADAQLQAAAAADAQVQAAVAAERQQFGAERRRLDRQLAEQQRLLQEQEAELQRMQRAQEDKRRQQAAAEAEAAQQRQWRVAAAPAPAPAATSPLFGLRSEASPAASFGQRRSVGAALAAAGGLLGSSGSFAGSPRAAAAAPAPAPAPLQQLRSSLGAAGVRAPLGVLPSAANAAPPSSIAAGTAAVGGVAGEDPLARARRQVLAAKEYLKSVAAMGTDQATAGAVSN